MDESLAAMERTAIEACTAGGAYLREAYRAEDTDVDAGTHDVKSSADTGAERRILELIRAAFPDHPIVAEESGRHEGVGEYTWLVDPLDGTNNFESGLPSFATAITVLEGIDSGSPISDSEPVLAVAYVPLLDDLYVATRGEGVRHNGQPVSADSNASAETATAVSVIGHDVKRQPEQAAVSASINRALEDRCKRRLESWSPTVHWGLLARRRLDGIVCYRPDAEEQLLGELFAAESGLHTANGGGDSGGRDERESDGRDGRNSEDRGEWFVAAGNRAVFDALREVVGETVEQ